MLHKALKTVRTFHRVSQTKLADDLAVSKSYISEVESGKKNVTMNVVNQYSEYFDIPASGILELSEAMDNKKKMPRHKKLIARIIEWIVDD